MSANNIRILSYLPSPRLSKATIAARLCGIEIEIRGDSNTNLQKWLWDFDARPLRQEDLEPAAGYAREARKGFSGSVLFKTDSFLKAHPFGTVPAAFSPDGRVGVFESNSIMRLIARLGDATLPLYGRDPFEASRIDSFLDASVSFATETQRYLLSLRSETLTREDHSRAVTAFEGYLAGIDHALVTGGPHVATSGLSIADICFVCEVALLSSERRGLAVLKRIGVAPILGIEATASFPYALAHYKRLLDHPAFAPDLESYVIRTD